MALEYSSVSEDPIARFVEPVLQSRRTVVGIDARYGFGWQIRNCETPPMIEATNRSCVLPLDASWHAEGIEGNWQTWTRKTVLERVLLLRETEFLAH